MKSKHGQSVCYSDLEYLKLTIPPYKSVTPRCIITSCLEAHNMKTSIITFCLLAMLVHTNSLRRAESSPGQEAEESLQVEPEDSGSLVESLAAGYERKKRAADQAVESLLARGSYERKKRAVQRSEENLQMDEQNDAPLLAGGYPFNSRLGWD